jgi:hypothetical protein
MHRISATTPPPRAKWRHLHAGLIGWLALTAPRVLRADSGLSYKYEDYRESGGRIAVQTQSALVEQDFGPDWHAKVSGVIDAIAGATPNGQPAPAGSDQVVLTQMHDRRKAWEADLARQLPRVNVALGLANSRESDYVSHGWSLNTLTDFNRKNTTLLAGVAGTDDDVKVFYQSPWAKKRTSDVIVGVNQLLDPRTSVTFDLTWDHATGYLSDPYKLVQKSVEVAPDVFLPFTYSENRPDRRDRWIAFAALNRAFPDLHAALEASYRFNHDTFGTNAHTIELRWLQHAGAHFILEPEFRFYDQSAADFYHYQLDATPVVPSFGPPLTQGPFYSSDHRLSALRTTTYGLKVVWNPSAQWQLNVALEQYTMRGKDGVTPQSAYPRATVVTGGLKISW